MNRQLAQREEDAAEEEAMPRPLKILKQLAEAEKNAVNIFDILKMFLNIPSL